MHVSPVLPAQSTRERERPISISARLNTKAVFSCVWVLRDKLTGGEIDGWSWCLKSGVYFWGAAERGWTSLRLPALVSWPASRWGLVDDYISRLLVIGCAELAFWLGISFLGEGEGREVWNLRFADCTFVDDFNIVSRTWKRLYCMVLDMFYMLAGVHCIRHARASARA